jgi:tight adherence protein C
MDKGVSEIEAYRHMGTRSEEPKYKTFSTLLVQNMRKGSGELIRQLERESTEAFEERKKRARILGEQAGTKLMFPMMLMLMVVFAILMVPAMVSFG